MKISTRLIGSFLLVSAICASVGGLGFWGLTKTSASIDEIGVVRVPSIDGLYRMFGGKSDLDAALRTLINPVITKEVRVQQYHHVEEALKTVDAGRKLYEPLPQTPEEAVMWTDLVPAWDQWLRQATEAVELAHQLDKPQESTEQTNQLYARIQKLVLADMAESQTKVEDLLGKIVALNVDVANASVADGQQAAALARWISIVAVVAGTLVAVGLGMLIALSITRPIHNVVNRITEIAQGDGDLTKRIDIKSKDEMGELGKSFNIFVDKVHDLVAAVQGVSTEVASASTEIASATEEMASGMDQQKTQVTQISAAIEEMSQSVVEVAKKSADAAGNANDAGKTAEEGGSVVRQTIEGMTAIREAVSASAVSVQELGKRGEQIGQIIEVINDIADQTNLLALNAAIEAARAGDHGRGFAVVADEVRKLADRTTKATEEIAGSIQAIQNETTQAVERMNKGTKQVDQGVQTATQAGQALQQIVAGARNVSGMVQSIAAAAEQQSAASEQVARSAQSMSSAVSQNAEASKQMATTVGQLSVKAEQLQSMIGRFRLRAADRRKSDQGPPTGQQDRRVRLDNELQALLDTAQKAQHAG
ncbi:MAG: methyl-accepting chemotaxis protein [Phycisphaeraceae bacterium]|nr:methyl-accepting chemotaxis protein [Phycisphaeraceae bacterium]